jgi:Holliday junction resolvase
MSRAAQKEIWIKKFSGEKELFDIGKLKKSLRNARAGEPLIDEIVRDIQAWLKDGVTTKEIYKRAYQMLKQKRQPAAVHYSLKQALLALGPTGFPFEFFIGEIFKKQGYHILIGQEVAGYCVNHEVDVIATKDGVQNLIECKFSKIQGSRLNIQVPMYVRSRIEDIVEARSAQKAYEGFKFQGWVITNIHISDDSATYSECRGLKLLGWDYPDKEGLKDLIESLHIFPITISSCLSGNEKNNLMEKGIVTCAQLMENMDVLKSFKMSQKRIENLKEELRELCGL